MRAPGNNHVFKGLKILWLLKPCGFESHYRHLRFVAVATHNLSLWGTGMNCNSVPIAGTPSVHSRDVTQVVRVYRRSCRYCNAGSNPAVPIPHSLCKNGGICLTAGKTALCGGGIGRHCCERCRGDHSLLGRTESCKVQILTHIITSEIARHLSIRYRY